MAISDKNVRLTVTVDKDVDKLLDEVVSLHDPKIKTKSKFVELSIVYFYLTCKGYTQNDENKKGELN